jgi:ATP adenylyltransferase
MPNKNPYAYLTAKERISLSFPSRFLWETGKLTGEILDFGCGFGKDVEVLKAQGFEIDGYDPYYFPNYPQKKFDTIICNYVLNVLLPEDQAMVLLQVSNLLKPNGKAYYSVRRDLKQEGYRIHKVHQKPTYQCLVQLPFTSIFCNENCEIYEFIPVNHLLNSEKFGFKFPEEMAFLTESARAFALEKSHEGRILNVWIIPKRHCSNFFELSFKDQAACLFMLNFIQKLVMQQKVQPSAMEIQIHTSHILDKYKNPCYLELILSY